MEVEDKEKDYEWKLKMIWKIILFLKTGGKVDDEK